MSTKRFIGFLLVLLMITLALRAGAATPDPVDAALAAVEASGALSPQVSCITPRGVEGRSLCEVELILVQGILDAHKSDCGSVTQIWSDDASTLWRVDCEQWHSYNSETHMRTIIAYGIGFDVRGGKIFVQSYARITSDAMWFEWLADARDSAQHLRDIGNGVK
jgi:hypothetical protein